MIYFGNPSSEPVREAMRRGDFGCIITPAQGNVVPDGAIWCADNGCFGEGYPGDAGWLAWLERCARRYPAENCLFAVAPDVPFDADATLTRSTPFLPQIRALGLPAAYAAQDGASVASMPWGQFDVLFIGGTTAFKFSAVARELSRTAVRRGLKVHLGRVSSYKRIQYAAGIGATSCDGTYLRFGPDKNVVRMKRFLDLNHARPQLDWNGIEAEIS